MMEAFTKHTKKVMWFIAAIFIAGLFFWFGSGKMVKDYVATVGKTKIKFSDFQEQVARQIRRESENQEQELTEAQIYEIKRQILSSLISQEMLYAESNKLGISVTDEELMATIHNLPQFQQDGQFNFGLYKQTLKYSMNLNPEEFEDMIKKSIAIRKLERIVLTSILSTDGELAISAAGNKDASKTDQDMKNEILQNKRLAIYQNWMKTLQQKTKIVVNTELIEQK